jgi:hypothetical protein
MTIGTSSALLTSVQQYLRTYDKAIELYNIFDDAEPPELLRIQQTLGEEAEKFLNISGLAWEKCAHLERHLRFLAYYLKRNDKEACAHDIRDILLLDLPTALKNVVSSSSEDSHHDQRLKDAVFPLIQGKHYDSAIRKTFILVTDRLRIVFGVQDQIDGDELVNLVFGNGKKVLVALDDSKKQAYRNLISGFYGVFRNRYAHNDVEPTLAEMHTIIEMANSIITDIERISIASASQS